MTSILSATLAQLGKPSFWEAMSRPKLTTAQRLEVAENRRQTIMALGRGKGGPFTAREVIDVLGESKECVRSALERMEKDGMIRRVNVGKVLHWKIR